MEQRPINRKRRAGRVPALDLVESAMHLLRGAPIQALLAYYVGSAPFVLGLLFFDSTPLLSRLIFSYYVSSFLCLTLKKWIGEFQRGSCGVSLAVMVTVTLISGGINVC